MHPIRKMQLYSAGSDFQELVLRLFLSNITLRKLLGLRPKVLSILAEELEIPFSNLKEIIQDLREIQAKEKQ